MPTILKRKKAGKGVESTKSPFFHTKVSKNNWLIGNGFPLKIEKIAASVNVNGKSRREIAIARQAIIEEVTGFKSNDFMQAYGRPEVVGSKGYLNYSFKTVKENGKNIRLFFLNGAVVPGRQRKQGNFTLLERELEKIIARKVGLLVKSDKNVFIQAQISASNKSLLRTLQRAGYAVVEQIKNPGNNIIILRKRFDSIDVKNLTKKKSR